MLPGNCCPVTSSGTSSAANGRAGEQYQVKARYQVRANDLLYLYRSMHISPLCHGIANSVGAHEERVPVVPRPGASLKLLLALPFE